MIKIYHAELFAGVGGFSLAAKWMGWQNLFQVEIDSWCREQLKKNFKKTEIYGDIKEFKGKRYKGKVDVLSGGFPCQPFSFSGERKGEGDDRYLWPEMLRVFKEVRPRFIVAENVPGIISMGIDQVLTDLEGEGYTCWPPFIIPACALGADHQRERVWIIAYSPCIRRKMVLHGKKRNSNKKVVINREKATECYSNIVTAWEYENRFSEPVLLRNKNGLSEGVDYVKTITAMGNAIVPQIAYTFFNQIGFFLN